VLNTIITTTKVLDLHVLNSITHQVNDLFTFRESVQLNRNTEPTEKNDWLANRTAPLEA